MEERKLVASLGSSAPVEPTGPHANKESSPSESTPVDKDSLPSENTFLKQMKSLHTYSNYNTMKDMKPEMQWKGVWVPTYVMRGYWAQVKELYTDQSQALKAFDVMIKSYLKGLADAEVVATAKYGLTQDGKPRVKPKTARIVCMTNITS